MAGMEDLVALTQIMGAVQGTSSKQRGKKTSQTQVSDEGIQELIRGILAGEGGVASVGTAARRAGLYNSTVEDQQLGNLYARAAGQAELARSPTVETMSGMVEQPGLGMGQLAGSIAGYQGLKKGAEVLAGTEMGQSVASLFGLGNTASGAGIGAASNVMGAEIAKMPGLASGAALGTGAGGQIAAGNLGSKGGLMGTGFGAGPAAGVGMNLGTMVPLGGSFLTGILGGKDAAKDPMSLGLNSLAGFAALGPMGAVLAPLASIAGGLLKGKSIICTALMERGLLDEYLYSKGQDYIASVSPYTKAGYYLWARKVAEKIRKGSKFWTRLCLPFAQQRTRLLASSGFMAHVRNPLGTLTKYVGEPICWVIGAAMLRGFNVTYKKVF